MTPFFFRFSGVHTDRDYAGEERRNCEIGRLGRGILVVRMGIKKGDFELTNSFHEASRGVEYKSVHVRVSISISISIF